MSNTKHTPGPWKIADSVMGELAIVYTGHSGEDNRHVCSLPMLSRYSPIGEEYKANAKLISAAPEMLEALKNARTFILDNTNGSKEGNYIQLVEAAIQKATE